MAALQVWILWPTEKSETNHALRVAFQAYLVAFAVLALAMILALILASSANRMLTKRAVSHQYRFTHSFRECLGRTSTNWLLLLALVVWVFVRICIFLVRILLSRMLYWRYEIAVRCWSYNLPLGQAPPLLVAHDWLLISSVIIKHTHSLLSSLNFPLNCIVVGNVLIFALWFALIVISVLSFVRIHLI